MTDIEDEFLFDEVTGEWVAAAEIAAGSNPRAVEVRDAVGNLLAEGDNVSFVNGLKVKGAGQTLKRDGDPVDPADG